MKNFDPIYILNLVDASRLLNKTQKNKLKEQLPALNEFKVAEIVDVFEEEMKIRIGTLKKKLAAKKIYAHKKIKALYEFVEHRVEEEEESELENLDQELATLN